MRADTQTATIGGKPITLLAGEVVIWQGRPVQGLIRNPAHIGWGVVLLAGGLWLMLAASMTIGLLLVLSGVYLGYFHAIVERNRRATSYYALTNQRMLMAYSLRVLAHPVLPDTKIELVRGRYDTVYLSANTKYAPQHGPTPRRVGFGHLNNGEELYNEMLNLQKGGAQPIPTPASVEQK